MQTRLIYDVVNCINLYHFCRCYQLIALCQPVHTGSHTHRNAILAEKRCYEECVELLDCCWSAPDPVLLSHTYCMRQGFPMKLCACCLFVFNYVCVSLLYDILTDAILLLLD